MRGSCRSSHLLFFLGLLVISLLKHNVFYMLTLFSIIVDGDDVMALNILVELLAPKNAKDTIKFVDTRYQVWLFE